MCRSLATCNVRCNITYGSTCELQTTRAGLRCDFGRAPNDKKNTNKLDTNLLSGDAKEPPGVEAMLAVTGGT